MTTVSVIVVNWNGAEHLPPVLDSLRAQDWPRDALEVVVVDNGSSDGSRELLAERYPDVVVEALTTNTGFAGGCNAGARAASGEYLCFINNDMRAEPDWVRHMVTPLVDDPALGATGGKVLDWDGTTVDFAGAVLNWEGRGGQVGFGEPYDPARHDRPGPILFANGGSLAIRADRFADVGMFDEDFFAYYEDVDLGWRLWLYGLPVRYVPQAVTYHHHHGTSRNVPGGKLRLLYERNALLACIKNYEDDNLARVLAPGLLLAVRRAMLDSGLDRDAFDLNSAASLADQRPSDETLATLAALEDVNRLLPVMLAKREEVQRRRMRSDASLRRLFGEPYLVSRPERDYGRLQHEVQELFALEDVFASRRPRVLVVTNEVVGARMAGPAIRAVELCRLLAAEADVTLAVPQASDLVVGEFDIEAPSARRLDELAAEADVIICQALTLAAHPGLASHRAPVVVDAYDPFAIALLEQAKHEPLAERRLANDSVRQGMETQLRLGDFFVCATDRQWAMLVGALQTLGRISPELYDRDPSLRSFVGLAPFGLSSTPPKPGDRPVLRGVVPGIGDDDMVLLWAGGIYNWFDPVSLVEAAARAAETHPQIKLVFFGGRHPNPGVPEMRAAVDALDAARSAGVLDRNVFFLSQWVPYEERGAYLLEADVGVSTAPDHAETALAFRTRFLDYLWAGLPVLCTGGDALAELARANELGIVVEPGDVDALADAMRRLADDPSLREQLAANARATAPAYTWERTLAPILEFVRDPRPAPDRTVRDRSSAGSGRLRPGTLAWRVVKLLQLWREAGTVATAKVVLARVKALAGRLAR